MKTSAGIFFRTLCRLMLVALILITACATPRYEEAKGTGSMVASWYGPDFHGKLTASGEIYDMYGRSCAHKSLPFGSRLRITNVSNGKSVDVVVNDRGPFVSGRDLDLSYGAAKEIEIVGPGTGAVRADYLGRDMRYVKYITYSGTASPGNSEKGPFTIQLGAFSEEDNASRLKAALELNYKGIYIMTAEVNGAKFYRVRIGKFNTKDRAYINAKVLADEGYNTLITRYEEQI